MPDACICFGLCYYFILHLMCALIAFIYFTTNDCEQMVRVQSTERVIHIIFMPYLHTNNLREIVAISTQFVDLKNNFMSWHASLT